MQDIEKLDQFVKQTCGNRDPSHGYQHMQAVYRRAYTIATQMGETPEVINLVIKVAWLHDVADHKYDTDGQLQKLVQQYLEPDPDKHLILNIIDRISYSREVRDMGKYGRVDWQEVLGDTGYKVRNIVSDADKLEALGESGFLRCVQYKMHAFPGINTTDLTAKVREHGQEKLLRLKDEYIRTEVGKQMAEPLHNEFAACLRGMPDNLSQYNI